MRFFGIFVQFRNDIDMKRVRHGTAHFHGFKNFLHFLNLYRAKKDEYVTIDFLNLHTIII